MPPKDSFVCFVDSDAFAREFHGNTTTDFRFKLPFGRLSECDRWYVSLVYSDMRFISENRYRTSVVYVLCDGVKESISYKMDQMPILRDILIKKRDTATQRYRSDFSMHTHRIPISIGSGSGFRIRVISDGTRKLPIEYCSFTLLFEGE